MKRTKLNIEQLLPHLLMNYSLIEEIGLMYGKMGGTIFFNIYTRYSGLSIYRNYADLLLEDIYEHINISTPIDFANGLCGIGWGIEYLVKNQFYEGCTDDLLNEIDNVIIRTSPETLDNTFMTGINGLLFYAISRVKSFKRPLNQISFDRNYMIYLYETIKKKFPEIFKNSKLIIELKDIIDGKINYADSIRMPSVFFEKIPNDYVKDMYTLPIGIFQGLTGWALKQILS